MLKFSEVKECLLSLKVLKNSVFQNVVLMLLFCAIAVVISVYNKFDYRWDFTNYHYYNPFAFFHDRLNFDIVPASINTFFNPLVDIPLYLLVKYFNDNLNLIFAVQGICFGLLLFVFYKIVLLFFDEDKITNWLKVILVLLVASTGQTTYFQIGSSTNEMQVALISFISLYMIFKMIKDVSLQQWYKFFVAGIILGVGLGLKPTIIYICISSGVALIFCYKYLDSPVKFIGMFALGGLLGYLAVNGWWMYKMWVLYDNPFFPFLNEFFKSPYFDDFNFSDRRFIPSGLRKLIFPYTWNGQSAETYYFDYRGMAFYTLALFFVFYMSIKPLRWKEFVKNKLWCFYAVFLLLAYMVWMFVFGIYRYIIVIEMLSAIFFVKILFLYETENNIKFVLYYFMAVMLLAMLILIPRDSYDWNNLRDEAKFVDVEEVKLPENCLLKLYNFPSAAVIVEFAKNNNFRALGYRHNNAGHMKGSDFVERGRFREIRDKIEQEHTGETVVIYRVMNNMLPWYSDYFSAVKKELGGKYCRRLVNNLDKGLCICVPENKKDEILIQRDDENLSCDDKNVHVLNSFSKKISEKLANIKGGI